MKLLDLMKPEHAYLLGLIHTDGTLYEQSRQRGRVSIELKAEDSDILLKIEKILPVTCSVHHRKRDTNFKENYESVVIYIFDLEFRNELKSYGLSAGRKSETVAPPQTIFSEVDYYRGIVDGDGSLGATENKKPFLSFVTSSEEMAQRYLDYVKRVTGRIKYTSRNKRDGVFNIALFSEDAQVFARHLYYPGCFSINRKARIAEQIQGWSRSAGVMRVISKRWQLEEDTIILQNTPEAAAEILERTVRSVKMRLWRLKNENN